MVILMLLLSSNNSLAQPFENLQPSCHQSDNQKEQMQCCDMEQCNLCYYCNNVGNLPSNIIKYSRKHSSLPITLPLQNSLLQISLKIERPPCEKNII